MISLSLFLFVRACSSTWISNFAYLANNERAHFLFRVFCRSSRWIITSQYKIASVWCAIKINEENSNWAQEMEEKRCGVGKQIDSLISVHVAYENYLLTSIGQSTFTDVCSVCSFHQIDMSMILSRPFSILIIFPIFMDLCRAIYSILKKNFSFLCSCLIKYSVINSVPFLCLRSCR